MSAFKLTLDELKDGDHVKEIDSLKIIYREDVVDHIHRLRVDYQNGRLELRDAGARES